MDYYAETHLHLKPQCLPQSYSPNAVYEMSLASDNIRNAFGYTSSTGNASNSGDVTKFLGSSRPMKSSSSYSLEPIM